MEKELIQFIERNAISPFSTKKSILKNETKSIFKTKDAKNVHNKALKTLSDNFSFSETANILDAFPFTSDDQTIQNRQKFFSSLPKNLDNTFLKQIKKPRPDWKPKYDIIVVTENEKTFVSLKNLACPVKYVISDSDVRELEMSDIVQVIDCENYSRALETLHQAVFLNDIDEVYLERHLTTLSGWAPVLKLLNDNQTSPEIKERVDFLLPLLQLSQENSSESITRDQVETAFEEIAKEIEVNLKTMTLSGESLMSVLSKGVLPPQLKQIISDAIKKTNLPEKLFVKSLPVSIDENELEKVLREQSLSSFTSASARIQAKSDDLIQVSKKLLELEHLLLYFDFVSGVSRWMKDKNWYPTISTDFVLTESLNVFLDKPQPISFNLSHNERCSILTGANSGGKTTLLEHIIQAITFFQVGLPFESEVKIPLFSEIYYFAKTKGSANKGAFENLLTQMSQISPGNKTLILADEIEAVTEPGVAGKVIAATAEYFINQGCFLVIATHLGHEINKNLPEFSRVDGIEAKGLNELNELIVDHNPVLGRLAHSTPELIIEKMANTQKSDYFSHIHNYIINDKRSKDVN